jgi:hypothetical protein
MVGHGGIGIGFIQTLITESWDKFAGLPAIFS